ncbi:hypothetical protein C6P45_004775 [Maudiozyma exigua]|uniref:NUA/TPR/MLP1-2-like domain-containing protein n=1 Tax=Maudiozyma exigua TaxID=34358 RepID=A0A9P6WGB5_MAUEX|nr:hypothetical protein C6P45_004775 [Kazachstania exigua]
MASSESELAKLSSTLNIPVERLASLDYETVTSLLHRFEQSTDSNSSPQKDLNDGIAIAERNIKLNDELSQLKNKYLEAITNLDIQKEQNTINNTDINKKDRQISLLEEHKLWMNSQFRKLQEELNQSSEERREKLLKFKRKVIDVTDQNKLLLSTQKNLRQRNSELSELVDKTSSELKITKDSLASKELEFAKEINENEKIKEILNEQLRHFENKVKIDIENSSNAMDNWERNRFVSEIAATKNSLNEYKQKCSALQSMIDTFVSDKNKSNDMMTQEFSHHPLPNTVDYSLKKQLLQDRQQKEELHKQLEILVAEMETKMPLIETFKKRSEELENQLLQTTDLLDKISSEKMTITKELNIIKRKNENRTDTMKSLRIQRNDLARQVQFLLSINSQNYGNAELLSSEEIALVKKIILNENENDYSDSQKVISGRLIDFRDIKELQIKNMELIGSVRGLAKQLESNENDETPANKNKAIKEAKLAIIDLQSHVTTLEDKINVLTKERDSLKLLVPESNISSFNDGFNKKISYTVDDIDKLKDDFAVKEQSRIKAIQEMTSTSKKQTDIIRNLNAKLQNTSATCSQLKQQILDLEKEVDSQIFKKEDIQKELELTNDSMRKMNDSKVENLQKMEALQNNLDAQQQQQQFLQERIKKLNNEKELMDNIYIKTCEENNELKIELGNLKVKMNALIDTQSTSEETCVKLEKELKSLSEETTSQEQMLREIETSRQKELEWYQNEISTMNKKYNDSENALQKLKLEMEEQQNKENTPEAISGSSHTLGNIPEVTKEEAIGYTKYTIEAMKKYASHKNNPIMNTEQTLEGRLATWENISNELYYSVTVTIAQNKSLRKRLEDAQKQLEEAAQKVKTEDHDTSRTIENDVENIKLLENQLSFTTERIENLTTQNNILLEKLTDGNSDRIQTSNDELISALKHERDILSQRVNILERNTRIQAEAIDNAKSAMSVVSTKHQESINKNHQELLGKINELNILQEKNIYLENEIANLTDEKKHNQNIYDNLITKLTPMETEIKELKNKIQERDQRIRLLQEESERWKEHSTRLSNIDVTDSKEFSELKLLCDSLRAELTSKDIEGKDMEEKFNRLKKQAHEKLDSNKLVVSQLNDEIDGLKVYKQELESQLKDKTSELDKMKSQLEELETVKEVSIDENKISDIKSSDTDTDSMDSLKREIIYLKGKLDLIDESSKQPELVNYISKLDDIKREFQETCSNQVKIVTPVDASDSSDKIQNTSSTVNGGDAIDQKKKMWQEEWEVETLKRIEDAKEDLKRHLRQPTEEKINRIVERRKKELEDNFDEMVEEKAKSLILTNETNLTAQQIKDEIKENLQTEMRGELELLRKKSFEEGRQQELMKTKLLERKLSKLEDGKQKPIIPENSSLASKPQEQTDTVATEKKQITPNIFGQTSAPISNPFAFSSTSSTSSFGTSGKAASPFGGFKPTGFTSAFGRQASPFSVNNGNPAVNIENTVSGSVANVTTGGTEPAIDQKNSLSETEKIDTEERPMKRTKTDE